MGDWSKRMMAIVVDRIEIEADAIGLDMVADIRQAISTPVGRNEAGEVIERSAPFDNPWLETGHLSASERHAVETHGAVVHLDIINDAHYARRLENGDASTNLEPRPFHTHARDRWESQIKPRIADAITGKR